MNVRAHRSSPWGKRLYFETAEFEAMMAELIARAGDKVFVAGDGIDVDRVLLKGFGIDADYVDLPEGVLGRTLFQKDGSAHIEVSRALVEQAETDTLARRRLRTTLGHEGGHVACHGQLFLGDTETISLFADTEEEPEPAILCRETSVGAAGYTGEWWEYQANQCMACLLLPKRLLRPHYKAVLDSFDIPDFNEALRGGVYEDVVRTLANTFDVSWQAVLIRLQELGFAPREGDRMQARMTI